MKKKSIKQWNKILEWWKAVINWLSQGKKFKKTNMYKIFEISAKIFAEN